MKRLFTIAVILMATSVTFAQAPLAKKSAASVNKLERVADLEAMAKKAKETKELQAAMAEKAAAAKEMSSSVLCKGSVNRGQLNSIGGAVIKRDGLESSRKALTAMPFKAPVIKTTVQEGNVTVTTDENGIITDVTGVDPKAYERAATGTAYYSSNNQMQIGSQSGMVMIVEDGDNVYIKNPITRYTQGSWVKGTKSGNVITIAARQPLAYSTNYQTTLSLRWGVITTSGNIAVADARAEVFTFTVDGNVLTLEGTTAYTSGTSEDAYFMGVFWDDDNNAAGYGDAETVLTYDDSYVAPSTELVTLPDGAQYTGWYMNCVSVSSNSQTAVKNQSVNVAFVDNDVYVQGISKAFPNAWVKGTIDGNAVKFDKFQYVGKYSGNDCWFIGYDSDGGVIKDATATYDAATKTITFAENILINAATDRVYYLNWFSDVVISEEEAEVPELVVLPNGAQATGWYLNCISVENKTEVKVKNQSVNVAFVDNDVYVQGISEAFPNAWVKGTINGTAVTFAGFQFVGEYSGLNCWFVGVNSETGDLKDATATYDAEAKTITFADDVLINAAKDKIYYLNWFFDVVVSEEKAVYEEPVITTLTAELPYSNTFDTEEEQAQAAIYDANDDKSTFTFEKHSATESMTARYRYNASNAADDYLVFPGVTLKVGVTYKVSLDAAANGQNYPERLEVVAGKEAKASQFTIPVITATEVATKEFVTISNNEFTVAEDGVYYIAVHAISDANEFYLYVDNYSISELDKEAPAVISDLAVVADAQGANKATVTFTVPAQTFSGTAITEEVKVTVKREGVDIYSETKAAGAAVSFTDEVEAAGTYTYSVTASCGEHVGEVAAVTTYIGYDTPDIVANVVSADKSGSVDFAWDAPAKGANGYIVNPADFKYNIYPVEMVDFFGMTLPMTDYEHPYVTGLTETSANVEFDTNSGEHTFTYFAITAENTTGESDDAYVPVVTGAPYQMPVFESVVGGGLSYWWGTANDSSNGALEGGLYIGTNASDGDGNCFQMVAETMGWINLQSGKVALAGTVNPTLTFDYAADQATPLTVSVITPKGESDIATFTTDTDYATATVSLVDFANEDWVRVIITGTFSSAGNAFIDNIRIYNKLDNNLVAGNITATARVSAGENVTVTVDVENQGSNVAEAGVYTVDLYCNGTKVQSLPGTALASNAKTTFEFTEATNVMTASELVWKAVVEFAADEDLTNNTTVAVKTVIKTNNYPAVTDLAGLQIGDAVVLTWSEPDMSAAIPTVVTDDFESYDGFTTSAGEWTFVDVDASQVGGFQNLNFNVDGADIMQSLQSFWVHDVTDGNTWNETFAAHSGVKYLAAMFRYDDGTVDDWAISPVLSGNAQTISFYAKSYSSEYPEKIEILYSTGSTNTADFISVRAAEVVPNDWTEYTAELPAGAKYFAIRSCATSSFMLMIDDVTYETSAIQADLAIVGYNIYRDGVKLNVEPVEEATYTDAVVTDGEHSYVVTVVYDKGESKISNVVTLITSGIESIVAKIANVSVSNKTITVANANGKSVSIYTADGKTVYDAAGSGLARIRVESGVYIVKVGNSVMKTIVK